ncbi:hypothetical protein TURU_138240 [Turdus rufiventris]|nr:hypothetical protein TURU_138240 [Turdus rufiventris]
MLDNPSGEEICSNIESKPPQTNSSRPGRPPKRTQSVTSPENSHIMPHSVPGLMSPGIIPPTGPRVGFGDPDGSLPTQQILWFYECSFPRRISNCLTAAAAAAAAATNAAIAEAMKVKKIKLEAMSNYHANNNQHGADSENGDLNSSVDEELSYGYGVLQTLETLMLPLPASSIEMEDLNCRRCIPQWGAGSLAIET